MYGLVNKAIRGMVTTGYGVDTWETIRLRAGVEDAVFVSNHPYPDELTYNLVEAATHVLGLPAAQILRSFGEYWVLHTALDSYGPLMKAGGRNVSEFLINLPRLHDRVVTMYPDLKPPEFECHDVHRDGMHLHYRSHRPGLEPFVEGLLKGVGIMFNQQVSVTCEQVRDANITVAIFAVTWSPCA